MGSAVTGNVGSPRRKEFTAIGDTVNLASRLEQLTKEYPARLIVSDSMMAALGAAAEGARPLGAVDNICVVSSIETVQPQDDGTGMMLLRHPRRVFYRIGRGVSEREGIVNLSRGGMLAWSVARWFGAGKSLARL